jgi:hypothetical protein
MQQTLSAEKAKAQIDILEKFSKDLENNKVYAARVFQEMGISGKKVKKRMTGSPGKAAPASRSPKK